MDLINDTLDAADSVLYVTATWDSATRTYSPTGSYQDQTEGRQAAADGKEHLLKVEVQELGLPQ